MGASLFPISLFATPNPRHQEVFYTVARAGHLVGGAEHRVERTHFPGHELIWCLRGKGYVRVHGRMHPVGPKELVWINCQHPHLHGADAADPWEVFWVRIDGPRLEAIGALIGISELPVIPGCDSGAMAGVYSDIFRLIQEAPPDAPALIHAAIAHLIAMGFSARLSRRDSLEQIPTPLRKPVEWMRLYYFQQIRVGELASMAGLSVSHFTRLFKAAFGTSPIDWLRRERISQAKRRLVESRDSIKQISEQVGYADRFFFSKDFKSHTRVTPREFRERETNGRMRQQTENGSAT